MDNPLNIAGLANTASLKASVNVTSNGDNAKTAKVNILANSGGVCYPTYMGEPIPLVYDFAGMKHSAKIPIDWDHDQTIGYANRFGIASQLDLGGVINLVDIGGVDVIAMVAQMQEGTPYEASIEGWPEDPDLSFEWLPEFQTAVVNNQTVIGPTWILRDWTLKAVALCKFGADYGKTQVSIAASASTNIKTEKGYTIRLSNSNKGKQIMSNATDKNVAAVEAPAEVKADEVKTVEAVVEAPEATQASTEDKAEVVETVAPEAIEVEEKAEAPVAVEAEPAPVVEGVKASAAVEAKVDPRAEYKAFKASFDVKAGEYFEAGLSKAEATDKYMAFLRSENAELNKRLSAIGRGGKEPVTFSDGLNRDVKAKATNPIRISGKTYND